MGFLSGKCGLGAARGILEAWNFVTPFVNFLFASKSFFQQFGLLPEEVLPVSSLLEENTSGKFRSLVFLPKSVISQT